MREEHQGAQSNRKWTESEQNEEQMRERRGVERRGAEHRGVRGKEVKVTWLTEGAA